MAIRNIRIIGDEILTKQCKPVKFMTPRISMLIGDMFETMYSKDGAGLAAPQVGVLRQVVVIDVGEEDSQPHVLINPEILSAEGSQTGNEGCLSVPGKYGVVTRPAKVTVRALDEHMRPFELEAEGILARCICHECDHLHGSLYVDLAEDGLHDNSELEEAEEGEGKEAEKGEKGKAEGKAKTGEKAETGEKTKAGEKAETGENA